MAQRQPFAVLLGIYTLSAFWSGVVALKLIGRLITKGPRHFFISRRRDTRPAILDDPNLGKHAFVRLKSVKLHYVACGPEDKPLMLFVHGFPEFWYSWRHQMKEFSKDYRCVAIDMRGYNESDQPRGVHHYTMDNLTADIKEIITALGYKTCTLVAHDWGGTVAWDFTWRNPDMVDRLIACNIPNRLAFEKHLKSSFSQMMKSWYMFPMQFPYLPELSIRLSDYHFLEDAFVGPNTGAKKGFYNSDIELYKYVFQTYGITGPINYYRAALTYKHEKYKEDKVKVPTLIIWGTDDGALEKEMAPLSVKFCDDCEIRYIKGCSHWVQQEEPEKVNAFMREWLPTAHK